MIARLLWSPSGNVMRISQPSYMSANQFRAYVEALIAMGIAEYSDGTPPLVEWDEP